MNSRYSSNNYLDESEDAEGVEVDAVVPCFDSVDFVLSVEAALSDGFESLSFEPLGSCVSSSDCPASVFFA